jgi:Carboxypeptidase regulatory-like domain
MSADDEFVRPRWQHLLLNRFVLVPGFLILLAAVWNAWVVTHDHGIVAGRVIDSSGAPVDGAEVKLWVFNFTTFAEDTTTKTKADGSFEFTHNPSHNIQVSAEKPGVGRSSRIPIRLYFRSEDVILKQPLRLSNGAP